MESVSKKYGTGSFRSLKHFLGSVSPKITQTTENDTVWRYRFRYNLDSKFYERNTFFVMGESKHDFGLEFMRKTKLNFFFKKTLIILYVGF